MRDLSLGRLAGLQVSAAPSALAGTALLGLILAAAGALGLGLPQAALGGLAGAALHWLGEAGHQLGHAWAARRAGHPMVGFRLWLVLGSSIYPADEGNLPAAVHIQRALGGPAASLLMTLAAGALAAWLYPLGGLARYLSLFATFDYLLIYTLGALLPLGFTDGTTLLAWMRRRPMSRA
jgi:hypothetical protein